MSAATAERDVRPAIFGLLTGAALAIVITAASMLLAYHTVPPTPAIPATVKIHTETGHGSGVHIGRGLILTAAHVVKANDTATIKTTTDTRGAEVLWVSSAYDVALLTTTPKDLDSIPLSCDTPAVGTQVVAYGNPLAMEFVRTAGQVIGPVGSALGIPGAYPVDMTILPGMSGGPIVAGGEVVGISVAVMSYPSIVPQLTGIGMAVSGEFVCQLMGRNQ